MKQINFDENWTFRRSFLDAYFLAEAPGTVVNLPHDAMISTKVKPDAPAGVDSGYFEGGLASYTKFVEFPKEWENESVGLYFDGAMTTASVDINGYKVAASHYGYSPFYADLTDVITFGEKNRITVNTETPIRPGSRWYPGLGLFRGVKLCRGPKVHIDYDGIFVYTREISDGYAFINGSVTVVNGTVKNRLVRVTLSFYKEGCDVADETVSSVIQVNAGKREDAHLALSLKNPVLWSAEEPNLYKVKASVTDLGEFRTHFVADSEQTVDEAESIFGVRTVTVDAVHGLRVNGKTVKLRGGCLHHDNGLLGAVSLYECEARKLRKMKELGFNAIRTTHNPMSAALIEACDRVGIYVFDEAFDCWNIAKRSGGYSEYFETNWEKDLTAFVRRDRSHPSVIIWSTGNEIPERGGLANGYTTATRLAEKMRSLDPSRPVSNGICSYWSGLDDKLAKDQNNAQNAAGDFFKTLWEDNSEPFTNGLDIVGYNYMEDLYEKDHEMYPHRVMMGSENYPREIGYRWPLVESLPYVLGEFTWTAWDYIGEAGLGKAVYVDPSDPVASYKPWELMPNTTSPFPWRTSNDADFDITGNMRPQGAYRSVAFGSTSAHLYALHPQNFGKVEVMSFWGFPDILKSWNYEGYEGKPIEVYAFSSADEAEFFLNGKSLGRKAISKERPYPNSVKFECEYQPGTLEVVCYKDGREVSRDALKTTSAPASLRITSEKPCIAADGHDCVFVNVEILDSDGLLVPDASVSLEATLTGPAELAGFGSGNPVTAELYTAPATVSFKGRASAVLRSGYTSGTCTLRISSESCGSAEIQVEVK